MTRATYIVRAVAAALWLACAVHAGLLALPRWAAFDAAMCTLYLARLCVPIGEALNRRAVARTLALLDKCRLEALPRAPRPAPSALVAPLLTSCGCAFCLRESA